MSARQHASLLSAVHTKVAPEPAQDASADDLLTFSRELKPVEVDLPVGRRTVYVYYPQNISEREAFQRHMRIDEKGISQSMRGIVEGIMARVRNKSGQLLYSSADAARLMGFPSDALQKMWESITELDQDSTISKERTEAIEKK